MFELEHVDKRFEGTHALADLSLAIRPRVTTALLGPSGCGKTTILRLLAALIRPDAGTVRFDGKPIDDVMALRRRVGYVVQDGGLFPHLSARGNVELVPRHLGWEPARITARLEELTALVRLPPEALGRYPQQISGGQRQRVALMRTLMLDPDVLLLDEPLGALDPIIRADLQTDLRGIFDRLGKTVVLVTHDLGEAGYLCQDLVLLREGKIVQTGTLADLVKRPADPFVTRFVQAQRSPLEAVA